MVASCNIGSIYLPINIDIGEIHYEKVDFYVLCCYIWSYGLFNGTRADANEYNTAVIGHIIQTKMNGGSVDTSVLEGLEMQKLAYNFAFEMTFVIQKHLLYFRGIEDRIETKRLIKVYKCKLLEGNFHYYECK